MKYIILVALLTGCDATPLLEAKSSSGVTMEYSTVCIDNITYFAKKLTVKYAWHGHPEQCDNGK